MCVCGGGRGAGGGGLRRHRENHSHVLYHVLCIQSSKVEVEVCPQVKRFLQPVDIDKT